MGVRRAMNLILDEVDKGKGDVFTYGPLIHNPQATRVLKEKGVRIVDNISDISEPSSRPIIAIRSHGVSPGDYERIKKTGAKICDATCPLVQRVHSIIKKYKRMSYKIIIIGDKGHAEVESHLGYAGESGYVIGSKEEIESLPAMEKVCVVAQTTQSEHKFNELAGEIPKKYPKAKIFNTICNATSDRQKETLALSKRVDAMVIVGGRNSANTARLTQICKSTGKPSFQIESEKEIDAKKLSEFNTIGVTAGASTPGWVTTLVVDRLSKIRGRNETGFLKYFYTIRDFIVKSNLWVAFGASALSYSICRLQGFEPKDPFLLSAASYIFAMHILNHFTNPEVVKFNRPDRVEFYQKYKYLLITLGILSNVFSLILAYTLGFAPFLFLLLISLLGIFYRVPVMSPRFKYRKLQDIPTSKDGFLALAWASVIVIFQRLSEQKSPFITGIMAFIVTFIIVFIRSILFSLKDTQGDRIVGSETIPIMIGYRKTNSILVILTSILGLILLLSPLMHIFSSLSLPFIIVPLYTGLYLYLYRKKFITQGVFFELIVDGVFFVTGAVAYIWWLMVS
jgi:4-hydroxy-3-methylbut-2-enyl diphosphate reductase